MGKLFKAPAFALYIIGGLWSFVISLGIIHDVAGTLGVIVAFFLLPITLYVAPWYAAFAQHNWSLVILTYGSGLGAAILAGIGSAIDKD